MAQSDPPISTVSAKAQVNLPKAIRQRRGGDAGARLIVEEMPVGVLPKRPRPGKVFGLPPCVGEPKKPGCWPGPAGAMIAIDAKIILRDLTGDFPAQSVWPREITDGQPVFLP